MAVESRKMRISGKDVVDFMNSFDSAEEVFEEIESKTKDLAKDVNALVESMASLFEQDALIYGLADVVIKVEMTGLGAEYIKAQIGNSGMLKHMSKQIDIARAKEAENGI